MTVKQLINKLQKLDPKATVILASDAEGNNFELLDDIVSNASYKKRDGSFDFGFSELTPKLIEEGFDKSDVVNGKVAIVLYPK
jgi:hypothetical protein